MAVMAPAFVYAATVKRVVDADTVDLVIDLGCFVKVTRRCRLLGLNAPERFTEAGKLASAWVLEQMPEGSNVIVETQLDRGDKYGRLLATVWVGGRDLNAAIVAAGHASSFMAGGR